MCIHDIFILNSPVHFYHKRLAVSKDRSENHFNIINQILKIVDKDKQIKLNGTGFNFNKNGVRICPDTV